jgi:hypothetical protein
MTGLSFDNIPSLNKEVSVKIISRKENVKNEKTILVLTVEYNGREYELGMYGNDNIKRYQNKLYEEDGNLNLKVSEDKLKSIESVNWL